MAPKEWTSASEKSGRGSTTSKDGYSHSLSRSHASNSSDSNHGSNDSGVKKDQNGNRRVMKRNRISYVCFACRKRKTRCDRGNPCSKCVALGTECVYSTSDLNAANNASASNLPAANTTVSLVNGEVASTARNNMSNLVANIGGNAIVSDCSMNASNALPQMSPILPQFQQHTNAIKSPVGVTMLQQPSLSIAPSNAHADALKIIKLEEEVAFWKKKAGSLVSPVNVPQLKGAFLDALSGSPFTNGFTESSTSNSAQMSSYQPSLDDSFAAKGFDQIRVCLDDSELTFFIHKHLKALHPPFSFISLVFRDPHLSSALASVFGFTYTHIVEFVKDEEEITQQNVMKFGSSALIDGEHSLIYYYDQSIMKHIQRSKKPSQLKNISTVLFTKGDRIEDFIDTEYPTVLKTLLSDMLGTLPPTEAGLTFYLFQFFKYVYPFYPFLNCTSFLATIKKVIKYDVSDPNKLPTVSWNFSKDELRSELEGLAVLMVIIQISHDLITVSLNEDMKMDTLALGLHKLDFTCDRWLSLSHRIFTVLNGHRFHSEDLFCCSLYQRVCCAFSPRENNLLLDQHPILHLGQLLQTALILGLHKDPTDFKGFSEPLLTAPEVSNYRRKLWIGLCNIIFQETLPLGSSAKIEQYHNYFFKNMDYITFMQSVRSSTLPSNEFDYRLIDLSIKKYQIGILMAKINKACTDLSPAPVSEVLFMLSKLESEVLKFEQLKINSENIKESIKILSTDCLMNISDVIRGEIVAMKLVSSTLIHNVLWTLYLKVEAKVTSEENATYYKLHSTLFEMMTFNCFKIYSFLSDLTSNKFEKETAQFRYVLTKPIQQTYLHIALCLLSLLLKLTLVRKDLELTEQDASSAVVVTTAPPETSSSKLLIVKYLYNLAETSFISLATQSSKYDMLKTSVLFNKTQCLFEYFVQILRMGRLMEVSTRFWDYIACNRPIPKIVARSMIQKWGLHVENSETIKKNFFANSSLHLVNEDVWFRLQKRLATLNLPSANETPNSFEKPTTYSTSSSVDSNLELNLDFSNFFDLDANSGFPSFSF
ncbi:unnamed protein product [Kluyveromyces dobzhanskii CBS 2104]|uniref:WGS project CCBQ000000000 data, contig 00015 n=1 Tax=Kluyveromyces dobzhanskii CBS 2104 TaxID=1427455 RepID=A0A0A8L964_9SACH|nr:unnamed protein product [Kluyveromyces dobzhanskii CBS 2104]